MADSLPDLAEESTKGSFILLSGVIVATLVSAVAAILVARFLGPEDYGIYSLSLVVPQVFFLLTDFGIREGIIKFTIEAEKKGEIGLGIKIIKYGILIRALAGIVSFFVLFVGADFIGETILRRQNLGFFIRLASVSVIFQAIFSTSTHAYIGLDKAMRSSVITQIQSFVKAVISVLLIVLGFGITGAVLGYVFGFLIAGVIGVSTLWIYFSGFDNFIDSEQISQSLKKLVRYGAPLYFSFIMIGILPQFVDVLLAFFSSNVEIGNFKAAANFMLLLSLVAQQLTISLLPAFTKLDGASVGDTNSFFGKSHKYLTLVIIPLTVLLILFSDEAVRFFYGSSFTDAGLFLAFYSGLYLLTGVGYLNLPSLFNGMNKTKETLKMNGITFFVALVICPFAINYFGIIGLIVTLVICYGLGSIYGMYRAKKLLGVSFDLVRLLRIYGVAFLSVFPVVLFFSGLSLIPKLVFGAVVYLFVYLTLVPLVRIVDRTDVELLKKYSKKIKPLIVIRPVFLYFDKILRFISK